MLQVALKAAALLIVMISRSAHCDITVTLSAAEYYRLTGTWRLEGMILVNNGVTTGEQVLVPECVHTITMEWYSLHRHDHQLQYTIHKLHSSEPEVLPVVQASVPWWGIVPSSADIISLEFQCNGSGDARVDVTIAISNRSHHGYHSNIASHHVFSLTKRCGDCHNNGGMLGRSCDHLQCINNGQCVSYDNNTEICICPTGYHGKHCEHAWCYPNCENGGYCVKPDKCRCRKGFTGSRCHKATCNPECQNGGRCVKVEVCQCNPPYYGTRCEEIGHIEFVQSPPRKLCVEPSCTAVLRCDVMATPTARITWLKNGKKIPKADHHYLMIMLHNQTNDITSSLLLIYDTTTIDIGWYTCLASSSVVSRRIHTYVTVSHCDESFSGNFVDGDDTEGDDDNDQDQGDDQNDDNNFD